MLWATCLVLLAAGCHSREKSDRTLLARLERAGHLKVAPPKPGELAKKGRTEIVDECAKQSYETASKGLIVSEVGLHEDVFMLRDRVTYGAIGYSLDARPSATVIAMAKSKRSKGITSPSGSGMGGHF